MKLTTLELKLSYFIGELEEELRDLNYYLKDGMSKDIVLDVEVETERDTIQRIVDKLKEIRE